MILEKTERKQRQLFRVNGISFSKFEPSRQLRFGETGRQTHREKGGSVDQSIKWQNSKKKNDLKHKTNKKLKRKKQENTKRLSGPNVWRPWYFGTLERRQSWPLALQIQSYCCTFSAISLNHLFVNNISSTALTFWISDPMIRQLLFSRSG